MGKKRKLTAGLVAAVVLIAVAGRFLRLPLLPVHPEEAVPQHSAMLVRFQPASLEATGSSNNEENLASVLIPDALRHDLTDFRRLFGDSSNAIQTGVVWAALQPTRTSGMDVLFVLEARGLKLEKMLGGKKGWRVRTSIYQNQPVMTVETEGQKFAASKYRNLLLIARHAYLVENAISQLKHPASSLCRDGDFKKMARQHRNTEQHLQVFFNLKTFNAQFAPLINPSKLLAMEGFEKMGSWAAFQFPATKKLNAWTGTMAAQSNNVLLAANRQASRHSYKEAFRALPDNLAFFCWLAVKNIQPNFKEKEWNKYFRPWMGGEIALAVGEPLENNEVEQFILLQTKKTDKAEQALEAYGNKAGNLGTYDFQMFKVRQLLGTEVSEMLGVGKRMPNPFVAVLGEYVLFSNSKQGLERWLGKYLAGQTFSKNVNFLQSLRTLPPEADGFLYFESSRIWQQLAQLPDERLLPSLGGNPFHFGHLAATMEREGDMCKFEFTTSNTVSTEEEIPATILWKASLASRAKTGPAVFSNPQSGEMEILIQDDQNQLYLISRSGRVLWRRKIDEPILSKVKQIDLNNNQEGQFVFSTASSIYLLDRQGNDLAGFPLKLQTQATNGVTVIDFFNSHDYQFFIACENGNAYGFDEKGSPVEGWRPKSEVGTVRLPLFHYQAAGKDFMVLIDTTGRMQVFQKNGNERFPAKRMETVFQQAPEFQEEKGNARMVVCDTRGKVFVTNLSGDHFALQLKVGDNKGVQFLFADVAGDERNDYVAVSGDELAIYFYEGKDFKKKASYRFPAAVGRLFRVRWKNAKKAYIGAFCENKRQLYLVDGEGQLMPQFPLAGTTPFALADLLGNGKPVVVVGNEESVVAYRIE